MLQTAAGPAQHSS